MRAVQSYEQPTFTDSQNVFLQRYAETSNRIDAMVSAGLAPGPPSTPEEQASVALAAAQIIAKAETMPISAIASALGGDRIALLAIIWRVCQHGEPREQSKALLLMCKIHGMLGNEKASGKSVNLILQTPPAPRSATPDGLPFLLDATAQK